MTRVLGFRLRVRGVWWAEPMHAGRYDEAASTFAILRPGCILVPGI